MTRPPDRTPDALVLIASPELGGALERVKESGWAGPVVVVGDVAEATELARALQPPGRPAETPATSGPFEAPATSGPLETPATSGPPEAPATSGPPEAPATSGPLEAPATSRPASSSGRRGKGGRPGPGRPGSPATTGDLDLMLDPDRRVAVSGGRQADLTRLEYDVLHALLVEPGRVRQFAELTEQAWGTPYVGDTTQVHSVVKRVRRKLDSIASPLQVQAVRGVGFRAAVRRSGRWVSRRSHEGVKGE